MEAFLAEPWWYIFGFLFFTFIIAPVAIVMLLFKILKLIRDWWHDGKK